MPRDKQKTHMVLYSTKTEQNKINIITIECTLSVRKCILAGEAEHCSQNMQLRPIRDNFYRRLQVSFCCV